MFNQFGGVKKFYNAPQGVLNEAVQAPVVTPEQRSQQAMNAAKGLAGQDLSTPEAQATLAAAPRANIDAQQEREAARAATEAMARRLATGTDVAPDIQADAQRAIKVHDQGIADVKAGSVSEQQTLERDFRKERVRLEFDDSGNITRESLIDHMSDFA